MVGLVVFSCSSGNVYSLVSGTFKFSGDKPTLKELSFAIESLQKQRNWENVVVINVIPLDDDTNYELKRGDIS